MKNGRVIYTDSIVPFGIIEIEGEFDLKERERYNQLKLGKSDEDLKYFYPGASVTILGVTNEGSYIKKNGKIINTIRNFSTRYGSLFQSSFDRVTNLSGSPVFNEKGEVVGMHVLATATTSYELKIDYINNIIKQLEDRHPKKIKRGDIGISIELIIMGIAKINYKLNSLVSEELEKVLIKSGGPPEIMLISGILPSSPAHGILKAGDIIYKIGNHLIGNNLLLLEKLMNDNVGKELSITVSRNSALYNLQIKNVDNAVDYKIKEYLSFSGATFHDVTNIVKYSLYTELEGVYLTYATIGSPFSKVSMSGQNSKNNYILTAINSEKIRNINEFISFFKNNCDLESLYVEGIDYNSYTSKLSADAIDLDFSNSLLQIYKFNDNSHKWDVESFDLKKFCITKSDVKSNSKSIEIHKHDSKKNNNPLNHNKIIKRISSLEDDKNTSNIKDIGKFYFFKLRFR
jgi:hypothetical protein